MSNAEADRIVNQYWIVATDGSVQTFGDAANFGSHANKDYPPPIVGMYPTADSKGYWLVGTDGSVFTYGDAMFVGSLGTNPQGTPTVAFLPN